MRLSGRIPHGQGGEIGGFPQMAKRPPLKKGGVANDVSPTKPRSAVMPRPTKDTSEPRMSRPGATTSPSNTIKTMKNQTSTPSPRPSGGVPRGFVSRTPKA
jgi:hypothetical protein